MHRMGGRRLEGAILARTLNEQIYFRGCVAFGQENDWYFDVQAIGLAALGTFKMNMFMTVARCGTGSGTKRIFEAAAVIQHFVD